MSLIGSIVATVMGDIIVDVVLAIERKIATPPIRREMNTTIVPNEEQQISLLIYPELCSKTSHS